MKKVIIHSLNFSPDGVSTAYLYNDIALSLKERGYEVVVLTSTPHSNVVPDQLVGQPLRWKIWGLCKVSDYHGITVYHIPQKKYKSTLLRLLCFVYLHVVALLLGLCMRHIDLILSPSPPLTIGWVNLILARAKGCKVVYNVQEIYPDILNLKDGFIQRCLSKLEHQVYNGSDAVTTIDQVFYDTIVGRFEDPRKLHIIPNFVDTDLYHPYEWRGVLDPTVFPDNDRLKVLYAGNIGFAQDWEPLLELAERTHDLAIDYIIIGEGVSKPYLEQEARARGLKQVHILPYQPRKLMPYILSYSDLNFIFMSKKMEDDGFPSKVYTIMACNRPLLVMSGEHTPIVNFLNDKHCAKLVTDRSVDKMVDWMRQVTRTELQEMGQNGMDAIQHHYTKEIVTRQYADLVRDLIGDE